MPSHAVGIDLSVFHGFIAVAPLKPSAPTAAGLILALFHGFIAVAPLKPGTMAVALTTLLRSSTASSPWPH